MSPSLQIPQLFQMSRGIETVVDLWRGYTEGLPGKLSVKIMYEGVGQDWRRSDRGRRFNQRMKLVLDAVERMGQHRDIPPKEMSAVLDRLRRDQTNTSLNHSTHYLKAVAL